MMKCEAPKRSEPRLNILIHQKNLTPHILGQATQEQIMRSDTLTKQLQRPAVFQRLSIYQCSPRSRSYCEGNNNDNHPELHSHKVCFPTTTTTATGSSSTSRNSYSSHLPSAHTTNSSQQSPCSFCFPCQPNLYSSRLLSTHTTNSSQYSPCSFSFPLL